MIAVFDLDGTLSDDRWRRDLIDLGWDEYHSKAAADEMINFDLIEPYLQPGNKVVIVTARPERYRNQTLHWLIENLDGAKFELLMRPDGDKDRSPELKIGLLYAAGIAPVDVDVAVDDREDVIDMYKRWGVKSTILIAEDTTADILRDMAKTFEERNAIYQDNYKRVAPIIKSLFPEGVPPALVVEDRWHLFELIIIKLTRFAVSGLTHSDSIHDAAIYAAMIEGDLQ